MIKRSFKSLSRERPGNVTTTVATKDRILRAAEELFARRGFDGSSLRELTSAAGVNLAAVSYHFGCKEKLIEKVLRRRLDQLNTQRMAALDHVEGRPDTTLE